MAVCVLICNIFLHSHNYQSLSSNFYHQGKTTTNSITFFCVTITKVSVQTLMIGENINGATLPVSQPEQGGASLY